MSTALQAYNSGPVVHTGTALDRYNKVPTSLRTMEDVEIFLAKGFGWSANTIASYMDSFRLFHVWGTDGSGDITHTLFGVTAGDVERWFESLVETRKPRTAALRIAGIRAIYKALNSYRPGSSPFIDMPVRLEKKLAGGDDYRRTALSRGELERLLAFIDSPVDKAIIALLAYTGLRSAEAIGLKWKDLQKMDDGSYRLFGIGKGSRAFDIPTTGGVIELVKKCFVQITGREPKKEDTVLVNTYGQSQTYHTLWVRVRKVGKRAQAAGVISDVHQLSPHDLRRTCVRLLKDAGMSMKGIQRQTRHKDINTLIDHYDVSEESAADFLPEVPDEVTK